MAKKGEVEIPLPETKIFLGILAVIIVGMVLFRGGGGADTAGSVVASNPPQQTPATGEVREFNVVAYRYGFEPDRIEVNQGDRVRLKLSSRDVPHGFAIREYGISEYLDGLREKTVEFTADKKGTFTFYCNVPCGGGHSRMRGKFIVK